MGFSESHCREALLNTGNNLERAMDYVLSHPPSEFSAGVRSCCALECIRQYLAFHSFLRILLTWK